MTRQSVQPPDQPIETDTPLWHFSVSLWQDRSTAQAALELQGAGWAVSHLLVAAFLAREGYAWDGREPDEIRRWREKVTQSLRALRTSLPKGRADLGGLRRKVAEAELESERVELAWWYQWLQNHRLPTTPPQPPLRLLAQNLVAAKPVTARGALPLLAGFAQGLLPQGASESFALELQGALEQSDLAL